MKKYWWLLTVLAATTTPAAEAEATKLLIIQPLYTNSHERVIQVVAEHLIARHNYSITIIRYRNDVYSRRVDSMELLERSFNRSLQPQEDCIDEHGGYMVPVKEFWDFPIEPDMRTYQRMTLKIGYMLGAHCVDILQPEFIAALRARRFRMAIVDIYTNECGLALAHALQLPLVGFWGYRFTGHQYHATSALNMPSVSPITMSAVPPNMSFRQRWTNFNTLIMHTHLTNIHHHFTNGIIQWMLPGTPSVEHLLGNVNVVLIHASFLATQSMALPPNMHFTGCLLCRPARPLPPHLQTFMSSAGEHGVVVFSFGLSMFTSDVVPLEFTNTFLRAFANFPQKFIMRVGRRPGLEIPDNVLISEYIPQMDVLGHRQTRAFISHCGVGSVMESLYSGVPVLAVPGWLDQMETALYLRHQGLAVIVERAGITQQQVEQALQQLLTDPSYLSNAQRMSQIYQHEAALPPVEHAAHWVDQVARFGELKHLRLREMSWYELWMIDVAIVYLICFCAVVTLFYLVLKRTATHLQAAARFVLKPIKFTTLTPNHHCDSNSHSDKINNKLHATNHQ